MNWSSAQRECNGKNGNLPVPDSNEELSSLSEYMTHNGITSSWLGITKDIFSETRWLDGTISKKYTCKYLTELSGRQMKLFPKSN